MLPVLLPMLMVVSVAAWVLAVWSALSIVRLAPQGRKIRAYFDLGLWRFERVRALTGPDAEVHLKRYRLAFFAFFAVIISVMVIATAMAVRS